MDPGVVAALAGTATATIALCAAVIVVWQVVEARRATFASAFKVAYDILQAEDLRRDRRVVSAVLKSKDLASWTHEEIAHAERVCQSYDAIGIMCRHGYLPTKVIADSWGDSLRTTWCVVRPLVERYRIDRNAPEFWDDYQWLAKEAMKLHGE